jgi:hypothetical protein
MSNEKTMEVALSPATCEAVNADVDSLSVLETWIDECDMNGDLKAVLKSALSYTAMAGRTVVRMGAWVVTAVRRVAIEFPCTSTGALVGYVLGLLVSSIPLVGMLLGALLTPFLVTAAVLIGFMGDVYTQTVKASVLSRVPAAMSSGS